MTKEVSPDMGGDAATARSLRVERLAELGTLTGHLAHEIRNPLSTIKVNLQLLAEDIAMLAQAADRVRGEGASGGEDEPGERLKSYQRQLRKIETITKEADRLADTLTDFLRYAGKMELHPVRSDVNELVEELIDFYEPQALSHKVQIRHSLSKKRAVGRVDTDLLKQALLNIFINATQAMSGGGELILRTAVQGDLVRIDIIDTGPGIGAEEQKRIFDPYYTTQRGGTGLGLPTCRRIIEEHGGRIELVSEQGKGSNFVITLPLVGEQASGLHH